MGLDVELFWQVLKRRKWMDKIIILRLSVGDFNER